MEAAQSEQLFPVTAEELAALAKRLAKGQSVIGHLHALANCTNEAIVQRFEEALVGVQMLDQSPNEVRQAELLIEWDTLARTMRSLPAGGAARREVESRQATIKAELDRLDELIRLERARRTGEEVGQAFAQARARELDWHRSVLEANEQ